MTAPETKIQIGILGVPDGPYVQDLQRAATLFPEAETRIWRYSDLEAMIGDFPQNHNQHSLQVTSPDAPPLPDSVIVRSMPLGSLEQIIFRMDCLQIWESQGIPVLNPSRTLEIAIDKWLTLVKLQTRGLPIPATITCQTRAAAMQAYEKLGGDVLVKPLFGGEGRGILRITDRDMAWRAFGTLQQLGQVLYVQQYLDHVGYDIRVLFVGDEMFSIKRLARDNAWRTNISQGGTAERHTLTEQEHALAIEAARAVGGSLLGVDLLPCRDGSIAILEVNAVPGWKGINQACHVDIASKVIQHALQLSRNRPPASPVTPKLNQPLRSIY